MSDFWIELPLSGGGTGTVTDVTASAPLSSSGGTTPNISITKADTSTDGYLSSIDWNTFNSKEPAISAGTTLQYWRGDKTFQTLNTSVVPEGSNLYYTQARFDSAFAGKTTTNLAEGLNLYYLDSRARAALSAVSPISYNNSTGIFTLGTVGIANGGTGQTTANAAFNALAPSQAGAAGFFLQSNGTDTSFQAVSGGAIPTASATSTSVVTSATTTYVTAITTTITTTAVSAPIYAIAAATLTTTTAASVAKYRVTINAVSGQEQLESLTALATDYTVSSQYLSATVGPGTYTVNFQIARNSGTGTVNFIEGTLDVVAFQGANSNGITQLTGALQAGPGSGSQVLSGVLPVVNGGTNLSSTTINQLLYSSANSVIAGLATVNTGALVTSSTGVPSITSGATANRLLRTNGTTVSFAQAALATDVSGTLPVANGGTGLSAAFASQRVPFSNGTTFAADSLFIYDTANTRFYVGQGGGTGRVNGTVSTTDPSPNDLAGNFFSRGTNKSAINIQNENTLFTLDMTNSGGTTLGAGILAEASRGTLVARTQSQSGDTLFSITAHGYGAAGYSTGFSAALGVVTTETITNAANGGEIYLSTTPNTTTTPIERFRIKQSGETTLVNSHLKSTQTSAPTISADANAGTGASASLARATDVAGQITLTTGTIGVSTGSYATITFNKAYAVAPIVLLTPASSTLSTNVYVTSTTTTFSINFALAGGISSTYVINYHCIETQ